MISRAHLDDEVLQRPGARTEDTAAQTFANLRDEVEQGLNALENDGVVVEVVEQGTPHGREACHDLQVRSMVQETCYDAT